MNHSLGMKLIIACKEAYGMILIYFTKMDGQSVDNYDLMRHDMTIQQNECAPSKDSDQPGHPPSLIRVFAGRSIGS